tara:strand:+ start:975 stop:1169 length:195 start_codon:yes stop_codon:yes gene_type:complete
MNQGYIEYKTVLFIKEVLQKQLEKYRSILKEQQKDKDCPVETYEKTLDICDELEYSIKQMERLR